MKLLVVGHNSEQYLAKTHEAFRKGLREVLNARVYGEGYPGLTPAWTTFPQIVHGLTGGEGLDVLLTHVRHGHRLEEMTFLYPGLEAVEALKLTPMSDYWNMTDRFRDELPAWLEAHDLTAISYYPQLPAMYEGTPWAHRFRTVLPTFDPALFNDWGLPKVWDVGHIGSGVLDGDPFYPERQAIRAQLLRRPDLSCLWRPHPGWGDHPSDHPQVGSGFSRLINQCRFFVCTGGKYDLPLARYFEVMASGSVLLAIEPGGGMDLHLVDGVNYVRITPEDVLDKLDHYLARPDLCASIAAEGYRTAMRHHSCHARAMDFHDVVQGLRQPRQEATEAFLLESRSGDLAWIEALAAYVQAFRADDPVSLLLPLASALPGAPSLDQVQQTLIKIAQALSLERFPDVVALEQPEEILAQFRRFPRIQRLPVEGDWKGLEGPRGRQLSACRQRQREGGRP